MASEVYTMWAIPCPNTKERIDPNEHTSSFLALVLKRHEKVCAMVTALPKVQMLMLARKNVRAAQRKWAIHV